jgi:hypothetical protein
MLNERVGMLALMHRWVRSYETVEAPQTHGFDHYQEEHLLAPLPAASESAHWAKDWGDEDGKRSNGCRGLAKGEEAEPQHWPVSLAAPRSPRALCRSVCSEGSSEGSTVSSGVSSSQGSSEGSTVCSGVSISPARNSAGSSEPHPCLLRNISTGSMRSFASQSSLTSDGGGETNSFYRLLDVETELPMILT